MKVSVSFSLKTCQMVVCVCEGLCVAAQHVALHDVNVAVHVGTMEPIAHQRFRHKSDLVTRRDPVIEVPVSRRRHCDIESAYLFENSSRNQHAASAARDQRTPEQQELVRHESFQPVNLAADEVSFVGYLVDAAVNQTQLRI